MAPETFIVAREALRQIRQSPKKTTPPVQFLSENTLVACSRVAKGLTPLELNNEEEQVLEKVTDLATLEEFRLRYLEEMMSKQKHSNAWKKVYAFSQFVGPVCEVFKQASLSPECTLAFGLIGLLFIQPMHNKSEIEEKLSLEIDQLKAIISQVKFSKDTIPSPEMDIEIQGLSAAIIDFLLHALRYQKKWGIVKILGSILSDFSMQFQGMVDKIRGHSTQIEVLAQRGYRIVLLSSKDTLDRTEQKIQELETKLSAQTAWFELQIGRLNSTITKCMGSIEDNSKVHAITYLHKASAALSPETYDLVSRKDLIRENENMLAPKELWQNHTDHIRFPGWMKHLSRPILWIGGKKNHRGFSWVSSFSLDLVEALDLEPSVTITYILCELEQTESKYTPLNIFKSIILQVLNAWPETLTKPENIASLPLRVFEHAGNSTEETFRLLGKILTMVNERFGREGRELFILIDRIDIILSIESEPQRFLNSLQQLNNACERLRIILTSEHPAPNKGYLSGRKERMMEVWVDTTKPSQMEVSYD